MNKERILFFIADFKPNEKENEILLGMRKRLPNAIIGLRNSQFDDGCFMETCDSVCGIVPHRYFGKTKELKLSQFLNPAQVPPPAVPPPAVPPPAVPPPAEPPPAVPPAPPAPTWKKNEVKKC